MKITRNRIAAAGAALAALALLGWAFAPRPLDVEAATVSRGRFEQALEEDGRTRVKDRYTISAPVAARLGRIQLRVGDAVQAGDAVAVLTPVMSGMVDERSRLEAAARWRAADAGVALAAARSDRARVALQEARLELQRTEKLAREGFVAASRLDSARLAQEGALREQDAAEAQRRVAEQERAMAAAALQPTTGAAGRAFTLRSPVAGVVLRLPLQSEATVAPGTALVDIGDPRAMEVVAEMLTSDAVLARPGTRAVIDRWGGQPVAARVQRVEPAGFTKVSALGVEEQRVNVVLDVEDPPPQWRSMGDGFRVGVRLIVATADDALLVPVGALFPHADGGMAVYRVDGGRARLQPVDLAARSGGVAWVRSGLEPGQALVVYPPPAIADGKRVKVRRH